MADAMRWRVGDRRSLTHSFSSQDIEAFAKLTGDDNPIHTHPGFADRSGAGGQVVHGMLAASFVSTLIGVHLPGPGALWNSFQINWRKMIRIGDTLHLEAQVTAVQEATGMLDLKVTGVGVPSGELYLEGKARVLLMVKGQTGQPALLAGKRVLVTGATGEVGGAICRSLARAGCHVVSWGRRSDRLQALAQELGERGSSRVVDLGDDRAIDAGLKELLEHGPVNGFVQAAAAPLHIAEFGDERNREYLRDHWQVDVAAFQRIASGLSAGMGAGSFIIAVLTQAVLDAPPPKMSAYVTAKMGAWGLVCGMAAELAPRGVRCNAVSPGMIETPYVKDMSIRAKQVEAASNPMRRLCTPEDVAAAVEFLAGPQAAFLNGVNLPVTGGARMP